MNQYQSYIHRSRYARWIESEGRREDWNETVERYVSYMVTQAAKCGWAMDSKLASRLWQAIHNMEVMPSMRALMTAGPALDRDNVAGYNCSYLPMETIDDFSEMVYILMCGSGVGYSVESHYTNKLPAVPSSIYHTDTTIVVSDSRIGWAKAYKELLSLLYSGLIPEIDYSRLRPKGSRLKIFGGRSSGPEPLKDLFDFTINKFRVASGCKLTPLEVHDICCKIADIVVVGGVRRSALISLSDLSDSQMRKCKSGNWYENEGQRALANNSGVYEGRPPLGVFLSEWKSLYESKSGERGIYNREAARLVAARGGRRDPQFEFGCNPCSEIILRPRQFCNLTEVVIRPGDTSGELRKKVEVATILGTIQSTLTSFRFLRREWKRNCEEERLLGVSLTGIMDEWSVLNKELLNELKQLAIEVNKEYAEKLGINPSTAITCVKPSGTVSQLVDSSSGLHPRYAPYYIRRVRQDKMDPLGRFLKEQGVPCEDDVRSPHTTWVFSFPSKSPEDSVTTEQVTAIDQLETWKILAEEWCEHKPSCTVHTKENEWMDVGAWVWKNFDIMSGVSFLPYSDHVYKQAPYEEITKEEYENLVSKMVEINWDLLTEYEKEDTTTGTQELACSSGYCEV